MKIVLTHVILSEAKDLRQRVIVDEFVQILRFTQDDTSSQIFHSMAFPTSKEQTAYVLYSFAE